MTRFRKISAYIILVVFGVMVLFSDFHHHKVVVPLNVCQMCQNNVKHPNHFLPSDSYDNVCFLCQWMLNTYNITSCILDVLDFLLIREVFQCEIQNNHIVFIALKSKRAPPLR